MLSVHTKLDKDPPFAKIYVFYLGKYVGFVKTSEVMRWMLRRAVDQIRARSTRRGTRSEPQFAITMPTGASDFDIPCELAFRSPGVIEQNSTHPWSVLRSGNGIGEVECKDEFGRDPSVGVGSRSKALGLNSGCIDEDESHSNNSLGVP